jgi:hypothetical protein
MKNKINNLILSCSLLKLKKTVNDNFTQIQIQNGILVCNNLNNNICKIIQQNEIDYTSSIDESDDYNDNTSCAIDTSKNPMNESYLFTSFIHIDNIFSPDDWQFIYNNEHST